MWRRSAARLLSSVLHLLRERLPNEEPLGQCELRPPLENEPVSPPGSGAMHEMPYTRAEFPEPGVQDGCAGGGAGVGFASFAWPQ